MTLEASVDVADGFLQWLALLETRVDSSPPQTAAEQDATEGALILLEPLLSALELPLLLLVPLLLLELLL